MKKCTHFAVPFFAACLALVTFASAHAADKLEDTPLVWSPTSPMSERPTVNVKGLESVQLRIEPFTDKRDDTAVIGRNLNKAPARIVSTRDDVPRFVTYQVKSLLSGLGLNVVESGGTAILKGEVKKFYAEETNRYNATVELRVTAVDPEGKVLWVVESSGTSSRFGIGYKAANYMEVLSDALIGAVHEVVRNPNFRKVLTAQ